MQPRSWRFRIQDILDAVASVRNLIVISEAAARVPDEVCDKCPEVPWADMRTVRNFVIHEYFGVTAPARISARRGVRR